MKDINTTIQNLQSDIDKLIVRKQNIFSKMEENRINNISNEYVEGQLKQVDQLILGLQNEILKQQKP